jgi:hypothetical protein
MLTGGSPAVVVIRQLLLSRMGGPHGDRGAAVTMPGYVGQTQAAGTAPGGRLERRADRGQREPARLRGRDQRLPAQLDGQRREPHAEFYSAAREPAHPPARGQDV